MKTSTVRVFSIFLMAGMLCAGCNNIPDCRNETEPNAVKILFLDKEDGSLVPIKFDSIRALNTDSIFYQDTTLSKYELILDPSLNRASFLFYLSPDVDTLDLGYVRNVAVVSEECGPSIAFSSLAINKHSFDSVALKNDFLDRSLSENLEIYY